MEDKTRSRNRRDPSLACSKCFGRARQWKTRQDKTRQDRQNTTRYISRNRRDPRLGCIEGFRRARLWKARQDSRSKTMKDKTKTRFLRVCAIEMHLDIAHELVRKNHAPRFVPARAVEMHVDMSQEPLHTAIYREKCPSPKPRRKLGASLRSRNALGNFTRATLHRNLQEKCPSPKPGHILCASLLWTIHKSNFIQKFTGKNARAQNWDADFV